MIHNPETTWSTVWRSALALVICTCLIPWAVASGVWKFWEWYRKKIEKLIEKVV
jgi:hypothetical protein